MWLIYFTAFVFVNTTSEPVYYSFFIFMMPLDDRNNIFPTLRYVDFELSSIYFIFT